MYSRKIELRSKDEDLFSAIYLAMGFEAFAVAKTKFGEKAKRHTENGHSKLGYGGKWCGSYVYEFAKTIRSKDQVKFDRAFGDYGFPTLRSFQNLASQQSDERRAEHVFDLLADFQSISKAECLYHFLRFCQKRRFDLAVLNIKKFDLNQYAQDLGGYLEKEQQKIKAQGLPSKSDYGFEFIESKDAIAIRECEGGRPLNTPNFSSNQRLDNMESILGWQYRLTPLIGFEDYLQRLHDWIDQSDDPLNDSDRSIQVIHGDGGVGKTRLAFDFAEEAEDKGWQAGTHDGVLSGQWLSGQKGMLLILDYPEEQPHLIVQLLEAVRNKGETHKRLRILLLCRNVKFIEDISPRSRGLFEKPIYLRPIESTDKKWELLNSAWNSLQRLKGKAEKPDKKLTQEAALDITKEEFGEWINQDQFHFSKPLIIVASAYVLFEKLKDSTDLLSTLSSRKIISSIVEREAELIKNEVIKSNLGIDYQSVLLTVAMAAITNDLDDESIQKLGKNISHEQLDYYPAKTKYLKRTSLWRDNKIPAMKPDIIAAEFLSHCLHNWANNKEAEWLLSVLELKHIDASRHEYTETLERLQRLIRILFDMPDGGSLTKRIDNLLLKYFRKSSDNYCLWIADNLKDFILYFPETLTHCQKTAYFIISDENIEKKAEYAKWFAKSSLGLANYKIAEEFADLAVPAYLSLLKLDYEKHGYKVAGSLVECVSTYICNDNVKSAFYCLNESQKILDEMCSGGYDREFFENIEKHERIYACSQVLAGTMSVAFRERGIWESKISVAEIKKLVIAYRIYKDLLDFNDKGYRYDFAHCSSLLSKLLFLRKKTTIAIKLLTASIDILSADYQKRENRVSYSLRLSLQLLLEIYEEKNNEEKIKEVLEKTIIVYKNLSDYNCEEYGKWHLSSSINYFRRFGINIKYLEQAKIIYKKIAHNTNSSYINNFHVAVIELELISYMLNTEDKEQFYIISEEIVKIAKTVGRTYTGYL